MSKLLPAIIINYLPRNYSWWNILSERKSPAGWWNAPALNPKMRRGLSVSPVGWKREEYKNTQGFRVVRAAGA
jgi:hypothetical protein